MPPKLTLQDMYLIAQSRGGSCLSKTYINSHTKLEWQCSKGHNWKAKPIQIKRGTWCPTCAGNTKCSIDEIYKLAIERGGTCLSEEYVNWKSMLLWKCSKGHEWQASSNSIKNGTWCPYCAGRARGSIEEMQKIAESRGGKCLSQKYIDNKTKLRWQCATGHTWEAVPSSIKNNNTWCPYCSGTMKSSIEEMQKIATSRGGKCLSDTYVNSGTKLRWRCAKGHEWLTAAGNVKYGTWCPYCSGRMIGSIEEMQKIAESRGGKCLSETYVNSSTKLQWRCAKEHEWIATPGKIKLGTWCPKCAGVAPCTLKEMQVLAKLKGGECCSTNVESATTKLDWKCVLGHTWKATPNSIKNGTWCAICSKSLGERICRAYFEQIFKHPFPSSRPKWLRNKEGNLMELDGYCEKLKLAFEHQGEQHYNKIKYFHASEEKFQQRLQDDGLKLELCHKRGVLLIQIPQIGKRMDVTELSSFIAFNCESAGIHLPVSTLNMQVNLDQVYRTPMSLVFLDQANRIAFERGGKCHSKQYVAASSKLEWGCSRGHKWQANLNSIKNGYWCPHCSNNFPLSISEMENLARVRGGKCLSKVYINNRRKLIWECAMGHQWEASGGDVKRGRWCSICAGNRRATIEEMKDIAQNRNGKCLSEKYVNSTTKLRWQCSEGHEWDAIPNSIKRGSWCELCNRKLQGQKKRLGILEMNKIAKLHGGTCLSKTYTNVNEKLRWQCKNHHIWSTTPASIQNGSWCPTCGKKSTAEALRSSIEEMVNLAHAREGKCLSRQYTNAHTKLHWRCAKEHEWEATPNRIQQGSWCPKCAGNSKGSILRMKKLALAKGGACISENYINAHHKLRWRCAKEHEWEATPNRIQQGSWCPKCMKKQAKP